jgi:itaconyl-CoA hydratase
MTENDSNNSRAAKEWRGRYFEDFEIGDVFRSRLGRTITETENVWFTTLTLNTNQIHFNTAYAERTEFGRPLVNSTFTLAIVTVANLEWTNISLPNPVFAGDTIWAESEVLDLRPSTSRPHVGIVKIRSRGINQHGEVVIEFKRTFMVYRRGASETQPLFPHPVTGWTIS